jgi:hypothetical protein
MNREITVGLALGVLSLVYWVLTTRLPSHPGVGPGPGFLPGLLAGGLFVVGLSFVHQGWKSVRVSRAAAESPLSTGSPDSGPGVTRRSTRVMAIMAAYVPAFYLLGFVGSTALLVVLLARTLGERRWVVLAPLAVAVPLFLYLLFGTGLGVPLPLKPLGR